MESYPTYYKEQLFRSRLEARWAAFFDLLDWPYVYEPFDLKNYIPDFILKFYKPLLVEVKPELCLEDLEQYGDRILKSGWDKESLIVGAYPFESKFWGPEHTAIGLLSQESPDDLSKHYWAEGALVNCKICRKFSIICSEATWTCLVKGCYEGDKHFSLCEEGASLWTLAHEKTRWCPRNKGEDK